ncbi:MAG: hypothetical protein ACLTT1_08365 [[Clostridium] scindens]
MTTMNSWARRDMNTTTMSNEAAWHPRETLPMPEGALKESA